MTIAAGICRNKGARTTVFGVKLKRTRSSGGQGRRVCYKSVLQGEIV